MIFQNQQANILRVNGALADNFANRPASQGTYYIFYSLDTQEIFYDDVTGWIKLGSGGGGTPVNIYNSDGTLTGNRVLSGDFYSFDLDFNKLFKFIGNYLYQFDHIVNNNNNQSEINLLDNLFILNTTISGNTFYSGVEYRNNYTRIGSFSNPFSQNVPGLYINHSNNTIYINFSGSVFDTSNSKRGFNLDLNNTLYQFGQITGGNQTYLEIADTNKVIFAFHNGNANGLQINFNNRSYSFGDYNNINSDGFLGISQKLVQLVAGNIIRPSIILNGNNNIISSQFSNVDNGFQLDNNNRTYQFGQINSGGGTRLIINDNQRLISTTSTSSPNSGISLNLNTSNYRIGNAPLVGNRTFFSIDDNNQIIFTSNGINGINGINFTFASRSYQFGHINGFNRTHLVVDDTAQRFYSINNANVNGIDLRFNNQIYIFGQQTGTNPVYFSINNNLKQLTTFYNNIPNGINFDYTTNIYQFGNTSLGFFQITNNILSFLNCNQLVFAGSLTTGTSGPTSGQHLKVTINSIDYVIELKQP